MDKFSKIIIVAFVGIFSTLSMTAQVADVITSKDATAMVKNLDLSVDQTAQIEKVLTSYRKKEKAITSTSPNADESSQNLSDLKASLQKQLSTILTPEQMKRWLSMQPKEG